MYIKAYNIYKESEMYLQCKCIDRLGYIVCNRDGTWGYKTDNDTIEVGPNNLFMPTGRVGIGLCSGASAHTNALYVVWSENSFIGVCDVETYLVGYGVPVRFCPIVSLL